MAKYYVTSGSLEEIVVSEDPKEACLIAFKRHINNDEADSSRFGYIVSVGESGFATISPEDMIFETWTILEALGIEDYYKADERKLENFFASKRGQIISALTTAEACLGEILEQLKDHDLEDEFLLKLTELQELNRKVAIYDDPSLDEQADDIDMQFDIELDE